MGGELRIAVWPRTVLAMGGLASSPLASSRHRPVLVRPHEDNRLPPGSLVSVANSFGHNVCDMTPDAYNDHLRSWFWHDIDYNEHVRPFVLFF